MKIYEDRSNLFSIGVGAMIITAERKLLLVRKKSKKTWSFPGGTLSIDDDLVKALNRELKEEIGLDSSFFEVRGILGIRHRFNPKHGNNIFVIFLLDCNNPVLKVNIIDKEEIAETRLFLFEDVIENIEIDSIVKETFKKYLSKKQDILSEIKSELKPNDSSFYKLFL